MLQNKNNEEWKIHLEYLLITIRLRLCINIKELLLNAKEFYKGRKEILIAFDENMFSLPKPYVFGEN